jgi:uncharacterized protein
MVRVDLSRLMLLPMGNDFVVLLRCEGDQRALPITIGQLEAQSIAIKLNDLEVPRPLTHDLLRTLIEEMGASLEQVTITELRDDTFYARLTLRSRTGELDIDCRPSDAIALALRSGTPVFVEDEVMKHSGVVFGDEDGEDALTVVQTAPGEPHEEALSHMQLLQRRLDAAVKAERYEEAAKVRDLIRKFSAAN